MTRSAVALFFVLGGSLAHAGVDYTTSFGYPEGIDDRPRYEKVEFESCGHFSYNIVQDAIGDGKWGPAKGRYENGVKGTGAPIDCKEVPAKDAIDPAQKALVAEVRKGANIPANEILKSQDKGLSWHVIKHPVTGKPTERFFRVSRFEPAKKYVGKCGVKDPNAVCASHPDFRGYLAYYTQAINRAFLRLEQAKSFKAANKKYDCEAAAWHSNHEAKFLKNDDHAHKLIFGKWTVKSAAREAPFKSKDELLPLVDGWIKESEELYKACGGKPEKLHATGCTFVIDRRGCLPDLKEFR